jgi:hypothetical protein
VGIGGTSVPGTLSETILHWFEADSGKNWLQGGGGGSGNLRGGAGGAGFCGGSGGIMQAGVTASSVGGGGGGSSFIADRDDVEYVEYEKLSDTVKGYLNGREYNDNASGSGGKLFITYLGANNETPPETNSLADVTLSILMS